MKLITNTHATGSDNTSIGFGRKVANAFGSILASPRITAASLTRDAEKLSRQANKALGKNDHQTAESLLQECVNKWEQIERMEITDHNWVKPETLSTYAYQLERLASTKRTLGGYNEQIGAFADIQKISEAAALYAEAGKKFEAASQKIDKKYKPAEYEASMKQALEACGHAMLLYQSIGFHEEKLEGAPKVETLLKRAENTEKYGKIEIELGSGVCGAGTLYHAMEIHSEVVAHKTATPRQRADSIEKIIYLGGKSGALFSEHGVLFDDAAKSYGMAADYSKIKGDNLLAEFETTPDNQIGEKAAYAYYYVGALLNLKANAQVLDKKTSEARETFISAESAFKKAVDVANKAQYTSMAGLCTDMAVQTAKIQRELA